MIRRALAALRAALANPPTGDPWTCPECGTENNRGRAQCMNGCGTRGPLAPPQLKGGR